MTTYETEDMLNKACKLLAILEVNASESEKAMIDAFFNEIKYTDYLNDEMHGNY